MGDRAQVYMKDTGVYLYTHWHGSELPKIVQKALSRKQRWRDPEYLARIIFKTLVGDNNSELGFGIGTQQHGDVHRVVEISCKDKKIALKKEDSEWWKEKAKEEGLSFYDGEIAWKGNFEDYLEIEPSWE